MTGLLARPETGAADSGALMVASRAPRWLRLHWMLLVVLVIGAGLRVLTVLAYQPAILYVDSFGYLDNLHDLRPDMLRPIGYDLILKLLLPLGGLRAVAVVQHLLGLGIAVMTYQLLLRHGARRWLAALATAPGAARRLPGADRAQHHARCLVPGAARGADLGADLARVTQAVARCQRGFSDRMSRSSSGWSESPCWFRRWPT